jgi:hypothetical protein
MLAHEINHLGGNMPGRNDEVTLILAVFVIHHNYDLPYPDVLDRTLY